MVNETNPLLLPFYFIQLDFNVSSLSNFIYVYGFYLQGPKFQYPCCI